MKRSFKLLAVALIAITPMLSSCADTNEPSAPATVQPQEGLITDLLGGVLRLVGVVLTGPDANGPDVSKWIGPAGGTISTAAYTLVVPANAVSVNTRFDVEPTNTGAYMLDLHAYKKGLLGLIDVGAAGFNKPVTLTVSYANAEGVENARQIVIVYVKSSSSVEVQATTVNTTNQTVSSQLSHFSKYAMVQN
jgi:hypothetical protein